MARPRYSKARNQKFRKAVLAALRDFGATPGGPYDYQMVVKAGLLYVSIHDNWIACRFSTVERAIGVTKDAGSFGRLNPYSGKWNFEFTASQIDSGEAIRFFRREVHRIMYPRKTLRDELYGIDLSGREGQRFMGLLDREVVDRFYPWHHLKPWPGPHKNIKQYWHVEGGLLVGWNVSPTGEWSFPVRRAPSI